MHDTRLSHPDSRQFIATLRRRAADMEAVGGAAVGTAAFVLIAEIEQFLSEKDEELLTLSQAEQQSGYSYEHLRKLVASGVVPNHGRKGSPRIRRSELPRKSGPLMAVYDAAKDVSNFLASKRSAA